MGYRLNGVYGDREWLFLREWFIWIRDKDKKQFEEEIIREGYFIKFIICQKFGLS